MTIHFRKNLKEALSNIQHTNYHEFIIHDKEEERINHDEVIGAYGNSKWAVVDKLNEKHSHILDSPIDLHNWLNYNENDEVSYFLNEAGSNTLSHSEYKAPFKFHLWHGSKGFVIGVEQKGKGFNARKVDEERIMDNKGAAFDFFRRCKSSIFFDNAEDAKIVYFEFMF